MQFPTKLHDDILKVSTNHFAAYHSHYKKQPKIKEYIQLFFFRSPSKQILSSGALSNFIIKVIKPLYVVLKANTNCFITYYLHYKDILLINLTRTFVCTISCLYFRYWLGILGNFLIISLFVYDSEAYTIKLGLVTKKRKLPKISLYIFYPNQSPSLLLS